MNRDLHDIDHVFIDAFADRAPAVQAALWQKLEARLDKEDAIYFRRKFIGAKRGIATLVFLLLSMVLYETGMQNTGAGSKQNNIPNIISEFKTGNPAAERLTAGNEEIPVKQKVATVIFSKSVKHLRGAKMVRSLAFHQVLPFYAADSLIVREPRLLHGSMIFHEAVNSRPFAGTNIPVRVGVAASSSVFVNTQHKKMGFKSYWTMGLAAFNDWTEYNLDNDVRDRGPGHNDERVEIKQRENHEPSWSIALSLSRQLTSHWSLRTGLSYSNINISIDPHTIYATTAPGGQVAYKYNLSSGYAYLLPSFAPSPTSGDSIETVMAQHNLQYLSIPLAAGYSFRKNKFIITPAIGLTANFLLHAKVETGLTDAQNTQLINIYQLQGTKAFYAGLSAGTTLGYEVSKKLSINLESFFKTALTPFTQSNVVKTYPFSFGIGLGASFRF